MKTLLATILLVVVSGNTAFAGVSASKTDLSKVEQKIERQLRVNPFAVIGLQVLKKQYDMCEKLMTSVELLGPEEGPAAGDYQFVTQYNCDNRNGDRDSAEE